jgi:hypothetical protein
MLSSALGGDACYEESPNAAGFVEKAAYLKSQVDERPDPSPQAPDVQPEKLATELPFIAGLVGVITCAVTLLVIAGIDVICASARVAVPANRRVADLIMSSIRGAQLSVPIM